MGNELPNQDNSRSAAYAWRQPEDPGKTDGPFDEHPAFPRDVVNHQVDRSDQDGTDAPLEVDGLQEGLAECSPRSSNQISSP